MDAALKICAYSQVPCQICFVSLLTLSTLDLHGCYFTQGKEVCRQEDKNDCNTDCDEVEEEQCEGDCKPATDDCPEITEDVCKDVEEEVCEPKDVEECSTVDEDVCEKVG